MSEKLEIVELDLGIDKVIANASKSQQALEKLRVEINALKKTQRDSIKAVAKYKQELSGLDKDSEEGAKRTKALNNAIAIQNRVIKNTGDQITNLTAQQKNVNKEYNTATRIIQAYTDKKEKELRGYKQTGGSIRQLGSALAENRRKYENLSEAERNNKQIGGELLRLIRKQDKQYKKLKESIGQAQGSVGNYAKALQGLRTHLLSVFSVQGFISLFKSSTDLIRNFELEIATLGGISRATTEELDALEANALKLGGSTQYTATEVAELQTEFARLGMGAKDIINVSEATLNGATALGSGLGETAKLVGATLNSFQKDTTETAKVVDTLAMATMSSALDFQQLNVALPKIGSTAKNAGVSLRQTATYLGILSSNGIEASASATGLKNIFINLSTKGISWSDAMDKIRKSSDKTKTSFELFGKQGMTAGVILATQGKLLTDLYNKFEKAGGSAKKLAKLKMETLDGALKTLNSRWQDLILGTNKATGASKGLAFIINTLGNNLSSIVKLVGFSLAVWGSYKASLIAVSIKTKLLAIRQTFLASATKGASLATRVFNAVMSANPIGLVITLLGSLVAWFVSSEERVKGLTTFLSKLWGTFKQLGGGVIGKIGKMISDAFSNPKKAVIELWNTIKTNIVNRITAIGGVFKALGKIISSGFTDGYKDLGNATLQLGTGVENVIDKTKNAVKGVTNAWRENSKEVDENNKKLKEQEETGKKIIAEGERLKKQAEEKKKKQEEANKALDKATKHQERLLQLYILQSNQDKKGLDEKRKMLAYIREEEKKIIEQKLKAEKITSTEAEIEQLKSKQKYSASLASLALENATKELEIYTTKNGYILDSETKLNADLLAKQKAFLDEKARLQIEALQKEQLSAEEFQAKKEQIERERDTAKQEKDKAYTEQQKADRQKDFEDKQALRKLDDEIAIQNLIAKNASEFEIQQVKLEQETAQKLQAVENEKAQLDAKAEEDFQNKLITAEQRDAVLLTNKQLFEGKKTLIEKQSAEGSKKIEEAKFQAKVDLANQALSALSGVLDKESEAGKAVAVAQAMINTAQGVTKAIAEGGFLGIATGAIVAAAGMANVAKIMSTKTPKQNAQKAPLPKASKGITLKGNSHANGGVGLYDVNGNQVVEAEGGENVYAITNKKASSLINGRGLLGALSYINERTGGIPLTKTVNYASMGGLVSSGLKKSTNVREVVDAFEQREKTLRVINVAEETMSIGGEGVVVENLATM